MSIHFRKYHGTGNDFIMIDNRDSVFPKDDEDLVRKLCDRHMGIGADGLILLENDAESDFRMVYFNADGREGSMCGNGGRCIVAFARELGIINGRSTFMATDGLHEASIDGDIVSLKIQDVEMIREKQDYTFLNTGSPHHVQIVDGLKEFDVRTEGRKLRYGLYGEKGSNINFVEKSGPNTFSVRTYERGVEDETLSCGTGVTAVALAMNRSGLAGDEKVSILTEGGPLEVSFHKGEAKYTDIRLKGPAVEVFKGELSW